MTTIEWTQRPGTRGETWNPIRARNRETGGLGHFCEHVSEGCRNCYAERLQPRFGNKIRYARQDRDKVEVFLDEAKLAAPPRWRKPRTVFVCSMTDLFGEWVADAWLDRIFAVMALTPRHTYQVLTKRPQRMRDHIQDSSRARCDGRGEAVIAFDHSVPLETLRWPLPNLWLGVSVEDQATAELRIPQLLETPAALRFVSYEPALGPVDFTEHDAGCWTWDWLTGAMVDKPSTKEAIRDGLLDGDPEARMTGARLDWIIAGGESGPHARSPGPQWFNSVRMQCEDADVPFFFKQWGGKTHGAGGRLLDGREYNEWPR